MIDTINLLWIIPLSALAGGFVLTVSLLHSLITRMGVKKNDNKGSDQDDRPAQG